MSDRSRITEEQDRRIYEAVVRGVPVRDVAARFGVSERTVCRHVHDEARRRSRNGRDR